MLGNALNNNDENNICSFVEKIMDLEKQQMRDT